MEPHEQPSGFLLINKPIDWTSHDVVGYLRKITRIKKIGHAGTLDPFATGLLIVGVGRHATKQLDQVKSLPKTYRATIHLGKTSTTGDPTGIITEHPSEIIPTDEQVRDILPHFVGKQQQVPPMYSAKKQAGKKLYELARQGITVDRAPVDIEIYSLHCISYTYPFLTIDVSCSPGTYIRTLAADIGTRLGTHAYCETLERTQIGPYTVLDAHTPQSLSKDTIYDYLMPLL